MKNIFLILVVLIFSCQVKTQDYKTSKDETTSIDKVLIGNWPKEITNLPKGISVIHTPSVIYATLNNKNIEKHGEFQLGFVTEVKTIDKELELIEFGGYFWEEDTWIFHTMKNRPFNQEEFNQWYGCKDGILRIDSVYSDKENWLVKTDYLDNSTIRYFMYFIGKDENGKKYYGGEEVIGYVRNKKL